MKEKDKNSKHRKHKREKESRRKKDKRRSPSGSSSSESDEWVEKVTEKPPAPATAEREDWMSMTGMLKTYTKEDIKPKREAKDKKQIDSYNPATSSRELNPYWKDGGTGVPETADSFRKRAFVKPSNDDDFYRRSSGSRDSSYRKDERSRDDRSKDGRSGDDRDVRQSRHDRDSKYKQDEYNYKRSSNWKQSSEKRDEPMEIEEEKPQTKVREMPPDPGPSKEKSKQKDSKYLSDEKMNKLGARIVKAEIMGDKKLVEELKAKLEAAREYRKQNPNAGEDSDDGVMLIATNSAGNSMPLVKGTKADPRSKGGKRKADTHMDGQRAKYFGNDDKYSLSQMFQQEKYGNNYDDEAQLARVASKSKNPNDNLEDIFVDEISKNRNEAKDQETQKQRAINQHIKMEKSLEGCEHCIDSKNMVKHLMVTCGRKVYLAVPGKQSLVKGHCIITTIQHATCVTAVDEDVWDEILVFRKALTQFFNSQNQDVVFYETAVRLHKFPHMVINCVPMPRDVGDVAAIYFKKALLECEAEWSMNKKVVELKGKNIRRGVPKGLPYFWIDFGMDPGFAHVIEDQRLFPRNFAEEVIGGILDLDHHLWKNPRREYGDLQRKKVIDFIKEWKPFESLVKGND